MRFRTGGNWDVLRINSNGHVRINYGSNDYTSHGNIDQYLFTVQTDYNTTGAQNLSIVNHNGNWVEMVLLVVIVHTVLCGDIRI